MHTRVNIKITTHNSKRKISDAAQKAFQVFKDLENIFSVFIRDSEISQLNLNAGQTFRVSKILFDTCGFALQLAEKSDGVFNPLVGLYTSPHFQAKPTAPNFDYTAIVLTERDCSIRLPQNARLDLNALVKGLALDEALKCFDQSDKVIIEAGGDIIVSELSAEDESWKIGIRNPLVPQNLLTVSTIRGGSVCTSGIYFRNKKTLNSKRFHMIDLKSGKEIQEAISATVVAKSAMLADALSTLLFLLPIQEGIQYIEKQNDVACLLVDKNGDSYISDSFKQYLTFNHAENK